MPRKKPALESFQIKRFTGIETKYSDITMKRGTLKVADGVNLVPMGQMSFGPNWQPGFGLSTLAAQITAALAGADATKVHFVTIASNGVTLLVAWDLKNARPQGMCTVAGVGNPFALETSTSQVIPMANLHTEDIIMSGPGLVRSVVLNLNPNGSVNGDRITVYATFPTALGALVQNVVIKFYNQSVLNTPLAQYTTDGQATSGTFGFVFNASSAWEYLESQVPA